MKSHLSPDIIKEVLESATGDKFALRLRPQPARKDDVSWLLYLPMGEKSTGWIDQAYEVNGKVVLETPIFFDVHRRLELDYPAQRKRKALGQAIGKLDQQEVRTRFADVVPAIVSFFDELENVVEEVNAKHSTAMRIVNSSGSILVMTELAAYDAQDRELVHRNLKAIMEFDSRMSLWLKERYDAAYRLKAD